MGQNFHICLQSGRRVLTPPPILTVIQTVKYPFFTTSITMYLKTKIINQTIKGVSSSAICIKMQYLPVRALDLHFHGLKYLEVEGIGRRTGCQRPCNFRKYIFVQKGRDYPRMAKSLFLFIAT